MMNPKNKIDWINPLKIVLWTVLLLTPFIHRPLFVDDHAHFAEAELLNQGTNFYVTGRNSLGWLPGQAPGEANPPLYFVLMKEVIHYAGGQLWKAHVSIMLLTLLGTLSFYVLAKRYVLHPVWATMLWLATPHIWLTANSLLLDAMIAPFLLAGLAFWMEGWDRHKPTYCFLGSLFISLVPLVKYTGFLGWVLVVLWTAMESRFLFSRRWLWLIIPPLVFAGWILFSQKLYGHSHFSEVAATKMTAPSLSHLLILVLFTVGTTPAMLMALPTVFFSDRPIKRYGATLVLVIGLGFGMLLLGRSWPGIEMGLGLGFFGVWMMALMSIGRAIESSHRFLMLWALLGVFVLSVAIPWVCARYLVILSPPLILLTVGLVEKQFPVLSKRSLYRHAGTTVFTLFGLALACADYSQASIEHNASNDINSWKQSFSPQLQAYYPGTTLGGLGYYLDQKGWQPLGQLQEVPRHSLIVLPRKTLPQAFWPSVGKGKVVNVFEYTMKNPLRTLGLGCGAGYYGSLWGPLPFGFSEQPVETFVIVQTD